MLTRRLLLWLATVTILIIASACETNKTAVGMTRDGHDGLVAVIKPCHADAAIFGLSVKSFASQSIVWQITSETGSHQRSFTLGSVPSGFKEIVPYSLQSLKGELQVDFHTSELPHDTANVDISQVQKGTIVVNGKQFSMDAFNARNTCG